jgi:hypothetical protein
MNISLWPGRDAAISVVVLFWTLAVMWSFTGGVDQPWR